LISNEKFNFALLTILVSLKRIERGPYNKVMDIQISPKTTRGYPTLKKRENKTTSQN
jgi:hypothetical protein